MYCGSMVELIGRDREVADLEASWTRAQAGVPHLAGGGGRRRVGKTFLLSGFASGKRAVYFTATRQDSNERQLARLTDRIREQLGDEVEDLLAAPFQDWEAALRFLVRLAARTTLRDVAHEAPRA